MIRILAGALAAASLTVPALAQRFDGVEITATDLGDGIYALFGAGGNIGLSIGEDGAFLIDDQFAPLTPKIEAKITELAGEELPVRYIVNTHYHGDHTGGNEALAGKGAVVIAHDNLRADMIDPPASSSSGEPQDPRPEGGWPTITFEETLTLHLNGETIHVRHMPAAHTDGDAILYFEERNIVHLGDLLFNGYYPYIDVNAGGSVDGMIANLEDLLGFLDDETVVIAGHGPLADKAAVIENLNVLKGVRAAVQSQIDAGKTLEDAVAANPLAEWDEAYGQFFIKSDKMVELVYRSLTETKPELSAHEHDVAHEHGDGDTQGHKHKAAARRGAAP